MRKLTTMSFDYIKTNLDVTLRSIISARKNFLAFKSAPRAIIYMKIF